MKKVPLIFLCLCLTSSTFAQESRDVRRARRGQAAGYASREATALSMMGWGLGLAAGIATLCALIDNNPAPTSH